MSCGKDGCSYNGASDANSELHARSGHVESNSALVAFLYDLMRDHLPAGVVEKLVRDQTDDDIALPYVFTNGHLARYAEDLAARLTEV